MPASQHQTDPALPAALKRLRGRRGLSQEALAIRANISLSSMSRIERRLTDPSWSVVRAIAKALEISLDELEIAVE